MAPEGRGIGRFRLGGTDVLLRRSTFDQAIAHSVFTENEYDLPAMFSPDATIIDIGAHVGIFCLAAVQRGAAHVVAVEPDRDNHALASINLAPWLKSGQVDLRRGAVWRSDVTGPALSLSPADDTPDGLNTGSKSVIASPDGTGHLPAFPLDGLIRDVITRSGKPVSLLKLDCEGSEWPILATSRLLHKVERIAGEFHFFGHQLPEVADLPPFTLPGLTGLLQHAGFNVYTRHVIESGRQGLFFASRLPG